MCPCMSLCVVVCYLWPFKAILGPCWGRSWPSWSHAKPSWDHLGATLKHLVEFENGDFTLEVLTKMTLCAIVCCRVVVCGVVCSCVLLLVVCNLRCSKTIVFYSV